MELFVKEMIGAKSIDDARGRAARVLESLEQSIRARVGAEAAQVFHKVGCESHNPTLLFIMLMPVNMNDFDECLLLRRT